MGARLGAIRAVAKLPRDHGFVPAVTASDAASRTSLTRSGQIAVCGILAGSNILSFSSRQFTIPAGHTRSPRFAPRS